MSIITPMPRQAMTAGAAGTPGQHMALGQGLVDLGNLVMTHLDLPVVKFGHIEHAYCWWPQGSREEQIAAVDQVAGVLGVRAELDARTGLYVAVRHMGPVSYRATVLPEELARKLDRPQERRPAA